MQALGWLIEPKVLDGVSLRSSWEMVWMPPSFGKGQWIGADDGNQRGGSSGGYGIKVPKS